MKRLKKRDFDANLWVKIAILQLSEFEKEEEIPLATFISSTEWNSTS